MQIKRKSPHVFRFIGRFWRHLFLLAYRLPEEGIRGAAGLPVEMWPGLLTDWMERIGAMAPDSK